MTDRGACEASGRPLSFPVRGHLLLRPGTLVWLQRRKMRIFFVATAVGAVPWLAHFVAPQFISVTAVLIGFVVVAVSLLWAGFAVNCPKCHLKLIFHAMTKESASGWLGWVLLCSKCPRCGYDAQQSG